MFYRKQPQHLYFKKPEWIHEFGVVDTETEMNRVAKCYDLFVNNYRYRGQQPQEVNSGYSEDLEELNLYTVAYTWKCVYEHNLYIDDLMVNDEYKQFLDNVNATINPENRPIIALQQRANDPWGRHLPDTMSLYDDLLWRLMEIYPDHIIVLLGEGLKFHYHPRIRYLESYINRKILKRRFKEYSACLQFVLAAYFCRSVDLLFIGISGFTLFIESIRPLNLKPPIPIFWDREIFRGTNTGLVDTFLKRQGWYCPEFEKYKNEHPEDIAFQHYIHHFLYYCRDEFLLKPYCVDYPNSMDKILGLLEKIESKYGIQNMKDRSNKKNCILASSSSGCDVTYYGVDKPLCEINSKVATNSLQKLFYENIINFVWAFKKEQERPFFICWRIFIKIRTILLKSFRVSNIF